MPAKAKVPARQESAVVFTDKQGNVQELPQVKSYEDTEFFRDTSELFPQLEQAVFLQDSTIGYDVEARPNLTGKNIIVREVIQMTKGQHGPYYAMHVLVDGMQSNDNPSGEFSVLTKGQIVNETIEQLSGVSLDSGKPFKQSELPVALRVLYVKDAGAHHGYFYTAPPAKPGEADSQ